MPPYLDYRNFKLNPLGWNPGPKTDPPLGMRKREDATFIVGVVTDIDPDRCTFSVSTYGGYGPLTNISVTQPFAGTNSYIAAMPDVGSYVILANQYNFCYPIAYIPNYVHGLDGKNVRLYPEGISFPQPNEFIYKFPKLRPGYLALGSTEGVELFMGDKGILKQMGDSIVVDGRLDQVVTTALNNFMFSGGVWRNSGVVTRNYLKNSNTEDGQLAVVEQFEDGTSRCRVMYADKDERLLSEYLVEVDDMTYDKTPQNEVNTARGADERNPAAILALGNFVGNNPSLESYGKILRPGLFNSANDTSGQLTFETLTGDDAVNYGMAISLFAPNRRNPELGTFIGIDKEGHYYQFVRSATCGGLGKGRSISIVAQGNKKEIFGPETKYGSAWELVTDGGIRWSVGAHNERDGNPYANRSIDVRTSSNVFYMYGGTDPRVMDYDDDSVELEPSDLRKYGEIEKVEGNERHEVEGNRETIVRASEKLQVIGMRQEAIAGAYTMTVGQDMNIVVTSVFSEKVNKEKQETFGSRLTTITFGDSELENKSVIGNITETISKVGFKTVKVTTGGIEDNIKVGSRTTKIVTGDSNVSIKAGSHYASTKSGNFSFSTKVGTLTAKASVKSSLVASLAGSATVEGGSISLKSKEKVLGGIVTDKTHFDYITGAPLVGSKTVKAAGLPG
jgi:hypothetical protein